MAADVWDNAAENWERHAGFVDAHMAAATERMLDAAGVGDGDAVLDVAAGPGGAGIAAAARLGPSGRVVLADVAPAMVAAAARRTAGMTNVHTLVCDELAIDAPDGTFDVVISRHGLMFAEPPAAAVREAIRVLRPGGRYAGMTWDARSANPWLGCILDAVGEQFGVPFPPPGLPGPFALDDPVVLAAALRGGGLEEVQVERVATPMAIDSLESWWELVPQLAGPLGAALAAMEPDVADEIRARALRRGNGVARVTGDGIEMPGAVLVACGRSPR